MYVQTVSELIDKATQPGVLLHQAGIVTTQSKILLYAGTPFIDGARHIVGRGDKGFFLTVIETEQKEKRQCLQQHKQENIAVSYYEVKQGTHGQAIALSHEE